MAQFDVYAGVGRMRGYVVDVQAELLEHLATRVVAPLLPRSQGVIIDRLTPVVDVDGAEFMVLTHELVAIPARDLLRRVGSLVEHQEVLKRSLDMLFVGF